MWNKSIDVLKKLLEKDEKDAESWYWLRFSYYKDNQIEKC